MSTHVYVQLAPVSRQAPALTCVPLELVQAGAARQLRQPPRHVGRRAGLQQVLRPLATHQAQQALVPAAATRGHGCGHMNKLFWCMRWVHNTVLCCAVLCCAVLCWGGVGCMLVGQRWRAQPRASRCKHCPPAAFLSTARTPQTMAEQQKAELAREAQVQRQQQPQRAPHLLSAAMSAATSCCSCGGACGGSVVQFCMKNCSRFSVSAARVLPDAPSTSLHGRGRWVCVRVRRQVSGCRLLMVGGSQLMALTGHPVGHPHSSMQQRACCPTALQPPPQHTLQPGAQQRHHHLVPCSTTARHHHLVPCSTTARHHHHPT